MRWFAGANRRGSAYRVTDGKRLKKNQKQRKHKLGSYEQENEDLRSNSIDQQGAEILPTEKKQLATLSSQNLQQFSNPNNFYSAYNGTSYLDQMSPKKGANRMNQRPKNHSRLDELNYPLARSNQYYFGNRDNIPDSLGWKDLSLMVNPEYLIDKRKKERFGNPPTKYLLPTRDDFLPTDVIQRQQSKDDVNFDEDNETSHSGSSTGSSEAGIKIMITKENESDSSTTSENEQRVHVTIEQENVEESQSKTDTLKRAPPIPRPRLDKKKALAKQTDQSDKGVVLKQTDKEVTIDQSGKGAANIQSDTGVGISKSKEDESNISSTEFNVKTTNEKKKKNVSYPDHEGGEQEEKSDSVDELKQFPKKMLANEQFRSSMLWNGQTSDRPPSVTDIYQTMPPNRYPKRNKDFMTQLRDIQEDSKTQQTAKEFRVNLDVNHYSPEEILVTLEDGKLIVNGKHFSESEYGFESCQFHRRYPIPDGIRKSDIKSTISEDGILTIIGRVGPPEVQAKPTAKGRFSHYDNVDGSSISPFEKVAQQSTTSPPTSPRSPQSPTALNVHKAANEPRPMPRPQKHKVIQEDDFNEVDHDTYLLKVNCVSYSPEDMEVRVNGRELIVRGRQKYTQLEDGQERLRHKEFTKRFSIPRQADCNTITSRFTDQDLLFVEVKKLKFNTRR